MRITTNQVMRNYQTALQSNLGGLTSKRNAILSGKKVTHASQDPSTAFVASGLERRLIRTQSYIDTIKEVQARQDEQENAIMQLEKACVDIGKNYSMSALNDPTGEGGRLTYAKQLEGLQKEMVSCMNAQYGDEFVFGGSSGMGVPFTINAEGMLCYRGVQVTPGPLNVLPEKIPDEVEDPEGYQDYIQKKEENEKIIEDFKNNELPLLEEMSKESVYIDMGFGLDFTDRVGTAYRDEVISSSAFNISLPGINVVGYGLSDGRDRDNNEQGNGLDEDGLPNNVIDLTGEMARELAKGDDWDRQRYEKLWMKFQARTKEVTDCVTTLGTQSNLMDATLTRMTDSELSLQTQIDNLVNIDPAEAIMEYSYADYTYNAALKIGTNILSQSLLDFLG